MTHAVCSRSFPLLVYLGHAFPGESIKGHMVFYCVDELLSYLLKKISSTHMKLEKVGNLCVAVSHLSLICMGIVSLIPLPMSLGFFQDKYQNWFLEKHGFFLRHILELM
jgi:hypothetical protein